MYLLRKCETCCCCQTASPLCPAPNAGRRRFGRKTSSHTTRSASNDSSSCIPTYYCISCKPRLITPRSPVFFISPSTAVHLNHIRFPPSTRVCPFFHALPFLDSFQFLNPPAHDVNRPVLFPPPLVVARFQFIPAISTTRPTITAIVPLNPIDRGLPSPSFNSS